MITLEFIKELVDNYFDVDLESRTRKGIMPSAKYCYYNLSVRFCKKKSLTRIAGFIGQDHATAIHYRDAYKLKENDKAYLSFLTKKITKYLEGVNNQRDLKGISKKELIHSLEHEIEENQKLQLKINTLIDEHKEQIINLKTEGMRGIQGQLNRIFVQLPERIQKDLLFKAKIAKKLNKQTA